MSWVVVFSPEAADDLERLFDHVLARELNSPTGDLEMAARAIEAIERGCQLLTHSPFSCRKVAENPFVRELIFPFGHTGYVALFEIRNPRDVVVGAVRHQHESDYH